MGAEVREAFLILVVIVLTFVILGAALKRKARKRHNSDEGDASFISPAYGKESSGKARGIDDGSDAAHAEAGHAGADGGGADGGGGGD